MAMIRFRVPSDAMVPTLYVDGKYGRMPMTYEIDIDFRQWAADNFCNISLREDLNWYIDIPEEGNAALQFKLTWL